MDHSRSGTDRSADERRSEAHDALRAGMSALCAELVVLRPGDRQATRVRGAVGALAAHARDAGVPPERLLVVLKRVSSDGALSHLGEWHRIWLREQLVQWAIVSYYRLDDAD